MGSIVGFGAVGATVNMVNLAFLRLWMLGWIS